MISTRVRLIVQKEGALKLTSVDIQKVSLWACVFIVNRFQKSKELSNLFIFTRMRQEEGYFFSQIAATKLYMKLYYSNYIIVFIIKSILFYYFNIYPFLATLLKNVVIKLIFVIVHLGTYVKM